MAIKIFPLLTVIALFALAGSGLWIADIWSDRQVQISILKPVALFSDHDIAAYGSEDQAIATVEQGTKVKVLKIIYGKDYMAFRIRTELGQEGWILYRSDVTAFGPEDRSQQSVQNQ